MVRKHIAYLLLLIFANSLTAQSTYIHVGNLMDVKAQKILKNKTIEVRADTIAAIHDGFKTATDKDKIIDLSGKFVLAGFIDMHVHLESTYTQKSYLEQFTKNPSDLALDAYSNGIKTLLAGFTTVRDLGGSGANVSLRNAINKGLLQGPRIFTARKAIAITGGHADPSNGASLDYQTKTGVKHGVCNSPEECVKAVRWQIKNGADLIKITATGGVLSVAKDGDGPAFSDKELEAIIGAANDRGVHVAAHAHGKEGMLRAVKAGVKTIEHGTYMDEEVFNEVKKKKSYYVPTITAGMGVADSAKIDGYFPEVVRPKAARIGAKIIDTFSKAYKKGVPIAFGTDAGVFQHGKNALEFGYMNQAGMPAWETLYAATITNAKLLKKESRLGQIKPGYYADIIAVNENPIKNLKTLLEVDFVMKGGQIIKE